MSFEVQNTNDEFCQISRELADKIQKLCQEVDSFHADANLQNDDTENNYFNLK